MRQTIKIILLQTALLILTCPSILKAQNLGSLVDLVSEKDKKATEKALNSIFEAGKLTQEASNYYNEALALQSNYELDEKTLQKELSKTEDKAVSLQIKADKLYAEAYKSLHEICKRNLGSATVSYGETESIESSADEMMEQAGEKRSQAGNTKNAYEKAALLNEAASLEGAALDNLLMALQMQNGITPQASPMQSTETYSSESSTDYDYTPPATSYDTPDDTYNYAPAVTQKSENLAVDQEKIDQYNAYVNDYSVPDPVMVNRDGVYGVDDPSLDQARTVFQQSHTPEYTPYQSPVAYQTPDTQMAIEDTLGTLVDAAQEYTYTPESSYTETPTTDYAYAQEAESSNNISNETAYQTYTPAHDSRIAMDISSAEQVDGVTFMVQIAASKIPLTRSQLYAIYPGNYTLEVNHDDSWYKYRITGFRLFSDANRVAVESGVKDAYVIAMLNKQYIDLPDARNMTRVMEKDVSRYGRSAIKNETDFYVQVAASRVRLTGEKLQQFCGNNGSCREVVEENWFKYQVYAGTNYNEALRLKEQAGGDAFVVAYERGKKMQLYKAINK